MKIRELRDKTDHELETLVKETKTAVQQARFKVAYKQLKNVRQIRAGRRIVARAKTLLRSKKQS
jgi:ribosomal protein L29